MHWIAASVRTDGEASVANELKGRRVAVLATEGVEQVELTEPLKALRDAGAALDLIEPEGKTIQAFNHLDKGEAFAADKSLHEVSEEDYDALFLPGGVANPDALRMNQAAVRFVRAFVEADKPVAAICHAPWMLVEAGVLKGRTITSWPSLRTDVQNAGGTWVDEPVRVDQKLITSRKPDDIPAFSRKMIAEFGAGAEERRVDSVVEQTFPASDPPPPP